ncbi:MAG: hypothetical protein UZ07_CHB004002098 [Chlorobi bacterium OLB7]|nr:MAG: hypothetical protein UZ07_CHB004002098 [Chlorobi bacterium OLB7]
MRIFTATIPKQTSRHRKQRWETPSAGSIIPISICVLLLLFAATPTTAQIVAGDAHGFVGQEVQLPLRLQSGVDTGATLTIEGAFQLSNPTVFSPSGLRSPPATQRLPPG